jgi:hypothetical protein
MTPGPLAFHSHINYYMHCYFSHKVGVTNLEVENLLKNFINTSEVIFKKCSFAIRKVVLK